MRNCPNCGDGLPVQFGLAKMGTCPSCKTTLILDGGHLQNAGTSGEMHDVPTLLKVGQCTLAKGIEYEVLGHARFDYGRGWWDEFWVEGVGGEAWISVDEGDVVLQRAIEKKGECPSNTEPPELGETISAEHRSYRVTEAGAATCIAVRGVFPEVLNIGSRHYYVNCTGEDLSLLSGEFSDGAPVWYLGTWLDPFELAPGVRD